MDEPTIPSFLEPDSTADDIPDSVDHRTLKRPGSQDDRKRYTDAERTVALAVYAETGSCDAASRETKIPPSTIRYWIDNNPDIDAELEALRAVLRKRLAWKYAEGAELAVDVVIDRLRNGDQVLDKEGNTKLRPVPAREAAFIASIFTDKHALLAGTMGKSRPEDQALTTLAAELLKSFKAGKDQARKAGAASYPQPSEPGNAT